MSNLPSKNQGKNLKARNRAVGLALLAFIVIVFAVTILRIKAGAG